MTPGDRGPSDTYYAFNNTPTACSITRTLDVPAGNYVVHASTHAVNSGATGRARCELRSPDPAPAHYGAAIVSLPDSTQPTATDAGSESNTIEARTVAELPTGGTITYECSQTGGEIEFYQVRISAIRVGAVHG